MISDNFPDNVFATAEFWGIIGLATILRLFFFTA